MNASTQQQDKVAIIGAGPAGLATARALNNLGIDFDIFEKHSNVGGIWDINNQGSPMYGSAHFISSKTMSGHEGYPMPEEYPDYPSNKQILTYIRDFAGAYDLKSSIQFNSTVKQVSESSGGWKIEVEHAGAIQQYHYRWLVCANGTNWFKNQPEIKGQETFNGEIIHSVDYHNSDKMKGKRVLVIGAGNSGIDIACDAAFAADEAYISMRRGYHFLPKHIFGEPVDVFGSKSNWLPMWIQQRTFGALLRLINGDLTRLGLQKPDHKVLSSHPIVNGQLLHYLQHGDIKAKVDIERVQGNIVYFTDGSQADVDLIIQATGYNWRIPYLNDSVFEWQNNRPQTFLKIFNRKHPGLFINGFVETNGGAYKLFDEMALLIAKTIEAQALKPELAKRIQNFIEGPEADLSGSVSYVESARHTGYTNSDAYRAAMKDMRNKLGFPSAEEFYTAPQSSDASAFA